MAAIASVVQFSNALAQCCFCFIDISKVKYDNKKYGMYVCFQIDSHTQLCLKIEIDTDTHRYFQLISYLLVTDTN